jgi:peptidoglycan-N-acetylglucosamine deacetylase
LDRVPEPLIAVWPAQKKCAISIAFDDGRPSQVDLAVPLLGQYRTPATFYLATTRISRRGSSFVEKELEAWQAVSALGHEIGNHTHRHPCSANFEWTQESGVVPLENMSLANMAAEIDASQEILAAFGSPPTTFAYPCGMTFVGRGIDCQTYVPLIAQRFLVGRTYNDECAAAPLRCDLACVPGIAMDNKGTSELVELVDAARSAGTWLILVGHTVGWQSRPYVTKIGVLEALLQYLTSVAPDVWVDTVASVGRHVLDIQAAAKRRAKPK